MDQVHQRLIDAQDVEMLKVASLTGSVSRAAPQFSLGGSIVEIERADRNMAVAYLMGERGARLAAHHFMPGVESAQTISAALAITPAPGDDSVLLDKHLRSLAA